MKKYLLIVFIITTKICAAQNVGIGTLTPQARLHVTDSSVLFTAAAVLPTMAHNTPVSGAGNRMMWYADKAAFRVGGVTQYVWDSAYIGKYSFATNTSTLASGFGASSFGGSSSASGTFALSAGQNTIASGDAATSMGVFTYASGPYSTTMGYQTRAKGFNAVALGSYTTASGDNAISMGGGTIAKSTSSLVAGQYNDTTATNRLFEIGDGTFDNARHNALTVLTNGNTGIGTATPDFPLSFPTTYGEKISVWGNPTIGRVGFGVQPSNFQMLTDDGTDITFGYGLSGSATENMRIKYNGNVGIGTTNPTQKLVVKGSSAAVMLVDGGSAMYTTFAENGIPRGFVGSYNGNDEDFQIGTYAGSLGTLNLTTNSQQRLSVLFNGNVGIGTTTPSSKLNVNGQVTIDQKNFGGYGGLLLKGDVPGNNYPNIAFTVKNNATTPVDIVGAMIQGDLQNNAAGAEAIDLTFLNSSSGLAGLSEKMRIKANGNVGIGTTTPVAKLHVAESSVLFTAPLPLPTTASNPPASGNGNRMMWYADKAAFRAGGVDGNEWDNANVGKFSFATGVSTIASGLASSAIGTYNFSTGDFSATMGNNAFAKAKNAVTLGAYNDITDNPNPTIEAASDRIFQLGMGTTSPSRANALTVLRNGNVGVGEINPGFALNFKSNLGDKISLYGNSGNHYGFGIQGGLLQMHTDAAAADIAFGYGSSFSFTERMRIKGNGNVGIGTSTPQAALDVAGYTVLGEQSAKIKMRKYSFFTNGFDGGVATIALGFLSEKVLEVSIMIEASPTIFYPLNYTAQAGYQVQYKLEGNAIQLRNIAGNCGNVLGKPIKINVTYEE
jgi:hypothetical protein